MNKPNNTRLFDILVANLRRIGVFGANLQMLLPDWWEDECGATESLTMSAAYTIAQELSLQLKDLLTADADLCPKSNQLLYIKSADKSNEDVQFPSAIMQYIANAVLPDVAAASFRPIDAKSIRAEILKQNKWVNFYALLDFCWKIGIPVLHMSKFPGKNKDCRGWKHPDAAGVKCGNRYVIFLCKNTSYQATCLFELAHELGHIMCGHFNGINLQMDDFGKKNADDNPREAEANSFAEKLLGSFELPQCHSPRQLAATANRLGAEKQVDPGHLVLHHVYLGRANYAFRNSALMLIEQKKPGKEDIQHMVNQKVFANIDLNEIPTQAMELMRRLSGIRDSE